MLLKSIVPVYGNGSHMDSDQSAVEHMVIDENDNIYFAGFGDGNFGSFSNSGSANSLEIFLLQETISGFCQLMAMATQE